MLEHLAMAAQIAQEEQQSFTYAADGGCYPGSLNACVQPGAAMRVAVCTSFTFLPFLASRLL